jgi:group I intron endonuclease
MNNNKNIVLNKTKIIPVVTYTNVEKYKSFILKENKRKSGIYRWNNKVTHKSYVGSSINLSSRLSTYYSKKAMQAKIKTSTSIIYSALLRHSYANFTLDILEYCEVDILIEREQYYLDLLKPEYNILKVANSRLGSKHSLKTRALISLKLKGVNHPFFGKTLSKEVRMKISESNKAFWLKIKTKREIKLKTPETLLKMSLRSHGVSVKVLDKNNNLVKTFTTIKSAAKHFGVSSTTMSRIENKGTYDNFIFKFEPKDFRVWVYDCNKKLVNIFNNNKETSKWCYIPRTTLHNYIKSGKLYDNKFYFYNKLNLANLELNKQP